MDVTWLLLCLGSTLLFVLSQALHDAVQAWTAARLGDRTPIECGRGTLRPGPHLDWLTTIGVPIVLYLTTGLAYGCGKRMPLNPEKLRHPTREILLVALAGPLACLTLAILVALNVLLLTRFGLLEVGNPGYLLLMQAVWINTLLFLMNLIPLPPMDGARVLAVFLSPPSRKAFEAIGTYGLLFLVAAFFSPLGQVVQQQTLEFLPRWVEFMAHLLIP